MLWRGVALCAEMHRVLVAVFLEDTGSIKINEPNDAAALQDKVGRLDVTVNDALFMNRNKTFA